MKQINIDDLLWEKISKFSKIIKWDPSKFVEYILEMMIDFYGQATDKSHFDISERIYYEFLEKPFLKELTTVFEDNIN